MKISTCVIDKRLLATVKRINEKNAAELNKLGDWWHGDRVGMGGCFAITIATEMNSLIHLVRRRLNYLMKMGELQNKPTRGGYTRWWHRDADINAKVPTE